MSESPHTGIVGPNCETHALDNVYIAGSSVFPTAGFVNPTFTLLALAFRLAEHLERRCSAGPRRLAAGISESVEP
jgi:choline dehydrogenase-like flavoprotein